MYCSLHCCPHSQETTNLFSCVWNQGGCWEGVSAEVSMKQVGEESFINLWPPTHYMGVRFSGVSAEYIKDIQRHPPFHCPALVARFSTTTAQLPVIFYPRRRRIWSPTRLREKEYYCGWGLLPVFPFGWWGDRWRSDREWEGLSDWNGVVFYCEFPQDYLSGISMRRERIFWLQKSLFPPKGVRQFNPAWVIPLITDGICT